MRFLILLISLVTFSPSCKDCNIDPDLTVDLLVPAADIILGEPVDWEYIIESTEANSEGCDILIAAASVGKIVIDLFSSKNDEKGDIVYSKETEIRELKGGEEQSVTNTINVFNEVGIYTIGVTADETNTVAERDEENNTDSLNAETTSKGSGIFKDASEALLEKLNKAAAVVIVGSNYDKTTQTFFKGTPIYYIAK